MRIVRNLILLCMLMVCQQYVTAQKYNLGKQKQSFAYETLYANQAGVSKVIQEVETTNTLPTQQMASPEDIQKCEQVHKQIVKLSQHFTGSRSFNKYNGIYNSLSQTQENILNLQKIQMVVISYLNSKGEAFPQIEKQLKNAASVEAEIQIFLSYYKE